jgi:DNA polymerase III delta prime subunit
MLPVKNYYLKTPWSDKYRPKKLKHLILNKTLINKFTNLIKNNEIPNMILTGYPGCGKTSTTLCLVKEFIKENISEQLLEFNASDNRGLDIIKTKIYNFCKQKTNNSNCKIIILDEADNLTKKAQNTISNFIDEFKSNTRFLFTCNKINDIIESVQSKCFIVNFINLNKNEILARLKYICDKEKIEYDMAGIEFIRYISQNDIRKAINLLETVSINGEITVENIYKIYDKPDPVIITNILNFVIQKDFSNAINIIHKLYKKGYCNSDILQIMTDVLKTFEIQLKYRILMLDNVSKCFISINNGNDSHIQMYNCIINLIHIVNNKQIEDKY